MVHLRRARQEAADDSFGRPADNLPASKGVSKRLAHPASCHRLWLLRGFVHPCMNLANTLTLARTFEERRDSVKTLDTPVKREYPLRQGPCYVPPSPSATSVE